MAGLKKAGSNWVDGDRFFDRDAELDVLEARVLNGSHTLLSAQRRMGKTSLIRELLRRLRAEGRFETVFVDLEDATAAADAVVEVGVESRDVQGAWDRIRSGFANVLRGIDDVLRVLEHDGYLEPWGDDEYRFFSSLLEDWWRARHGRHFVPVAQRSGSRGG